MQASAPGRMVRGDGTIVAYSDIPTAEIVKHLRVGNITPALRDKLNAELAVREARADLEFKQEVLDALIAEGKAPHVAASLTDSEAKLLVQARRLGVL